MADRRPPPANPGRFTKEGYAVSGAWLKQRLTPAGWRALRQGLTVREKPQPGAPLAAIRHARTYECFKYDSATDVLTLPRRLGTFVDQAAQEPPGTFGGEPALVRRLPPAACDSGLELYPYQEAYVTHLVERRLGPAQRRAGTGQVYVHVGTGRGKTYMLAALVGRLRVPTLVVVPTLLLQKDGADLLADVYPALRVERYSNDLDRRRARSGLPPVTAATADVVFCVVNTARSKPRAFFEGYGLVVFDEAHEYHSPQNSKLLWKAQALCMVGLSATPHDRPDGMDRVVSGFLGKPLPLEEVVPAGLIENITFAGRVLEVQYSGHPDFACNVQGANGTTSAICTIGGVVKDPHRFEVVAAAVRHLLELHTTLGPAGLDEAGLGPFRLPDGTVTVRQHSVLVFAEHREYAPALRDLLSARFPELNILDDTGAEPVVLRGGATAGEVDAAHRARLVLTTYGYSRRGVSLVQMTAMVLATPRRNGLTQILGRIRRLTPDPALRSVRRVVVDLRDVKVALAAQTSARRQAYRAEGWPVAKVKANYTDFPVGGGGVFPAAEEGAGAEAEAEVEVGAAPATLDDL